MGEAKLPRGSFAPPMVENGSHGFPRVSCYGHRGEQVDNGRKWPKMAENGRKLISACFPSWPSRWAGRQWSKMVENGRKWSKKSSPRLFGRKWIFAHLSPFPYYLIPHCIFVEIEGQHFILISFIDSIRQISQWIDMLCYSLQLITALYVLPFYLQYHSLYFI